MEHLRPKRPRILHDDEDKDQGDTIRYSGSHGEEAKLRREVSKRKGKPETILSDYTNYLMS
ncbi:hypothetical protein RUND412_002353 [Rhizina undulata]